MVHVQSTMMPATVSVNSLATHQPNLEAGSVYSLTGFDVTRCNQNYRLSDSPLLVRFSDSTSFKKVTEPAVPIPLESFRFRNHSEMLGLASIVTLHRTRIMLWRQSRWRSKTFELCYLHNYLDLLTTFSLLFCLRMIQ
ncbi:unnamed protein product [Brassica rapa subsp. trilocularis]